jgi:hypothetical protein
MKNVIVAICFVLFAMSGYGATKAPKAIEDISCEADVVEGNDNFHVSLFIHLLSVQEPEKKGFTVYNASVLYTKRGKEDGQPLNEKEELPENTVYATETKKTTEWTVAHDYMKENYSIVLDKKTGKSKWVDAFTGMEAVCK